MPAANQRLHHIKPQTCGRWFAGSKLARRVNGFDCQKKIKIFDRRLLSIIASAKQESSA